jgi:hypothetical protein
MTAVEFLYERLERMIPRTALYNMDKEDYFKQANELFEQQIKDAYVDGFKECEKIHEEAFFIQDLSETYYNETYKK